MTLSLSQTGQIIGQVTPSVAGSVKTQLIAHDKEVYDIAFSRAGGGKDMFASVGNFALDFKMKPLNYVFLINILLEIFSDHFIFKFSFQWNFFWRRWWFCPNVWSPSLGTLHYHLRRQSASTAAAFGVE